MSSHWIAQKVSQHRVCPEGSYRYFSIFIPILQVDGEPHLLYEIRAHHLMTQPGEVCFPGGAVEKNESTKAAALRETSEELGLALDQLTLFGEIDTLITPFGLILKVFVGEIKEKTLDQIPYSPDEVESLFTVPLAFFMENEPEVHLLEAQMRPSEAFPHHLIVEEGETYNFRTASYPVLFYRYKDKIIWGMTARMTKNLVDILKK